MLASLPTLRATRSAQAAEPGSECGKVECHAYASGAAAFRAVLAEHPRVLGVGEAHALTDARVPSATLRFTREMLPLLVGVASDLVVEVMLPNPACRKATETVRDAQRVVTKHQAKTDQDEFVALAEAAGRLGITPHPLRPSCDDLARIAAAGPNAVLTSLSIVTRLLTETTEQLLARGDGRAIVVYGGALHNDAAPDAAVAAWSYGPALEKATAGKYVELDLIVPEFVKDTPAWRALPWFDAFRRAPHPDKVTLYRPTRASFALVFARTR